MGEEVYSNLWGPALVKTTNKKKYFISFTDNYSRYTIIYLIPKKSYTFESYLKFETWLHTQHGLRIKKLHSDRRGKYLSKEFTKYLKNSGTIR